ncbi:MAG: HlyD family efflux transporter periplasmic adaptor subunit [Lachnospiraceae bacterium]|nr:HlyD family efflux transporter periplasmic adaptor subunit [Lachnospiraceae bacterium]
MKQLSKKKEKITALIIVLLLCLVIGTWAVTAAVSGDQEEVTYRETIVQYGGLAVGVTESGSVDIGTVEQTFDLDMSALQRASTGDSTSGSGGAGGMQMQGAGGGTAMFDQIFNMAGGSTFSTSGEASSLTVSKICVSAGQQVAEGDILYELEEESVSELTEQLQSDVEKAKADLDAVYADQELSKQTASYTYESSLAYGSYAETEYNAAVAQLQQAVTEAEETLADTQKTLEAYNSQLEEINAAYEEALQHLANCEWSMNHRDKINETYYYVDDFQMAQTAQSAVDTLEQKKERLEQNIEQAQKNLEQAQVNLNTAQRKLAQGLLDAKETLELRQLAYDSAQETYDIALAYLEEDAAEQEETYAEAMEKWEEYSSHVDGTAIRCQYNGVITDVALAEGDSIHTGTVLVTLYNMDEITMTVTVDEEDMADIALGSQANVDLIAYPDITFRASVTQISDASTDSSGNVTYDVTITLEGDVSGLFQGMTGEITFITEETQEVLYVSKRAIFTEGDTTYVKVQDEDGTVRKVEVTIGFTDGVNTEITGGLAEGDVVLIESTVSRK